MSGEMVQSKVLADLLGRIPGVVASSVASSTVAGYDGHWARWLSFCLQHGIRSSPAEEDHICAYLISLCDASQSMAPTLSARSAIGFYHRLQFLRLAVPTDSIRVAMCMAGLRRKWDKPKKKAALFIPDVVRRVRDDLMGGDPVSLKNH